MTELYESAVTNRVKLAASRKGVRLWRNNIGAGKLDGSRFVRFGIANETSAMNRTIKSGDLIGIKPVTITQDMVGKTIGQFVSLEIKESGWKYRATPREQAQLCWANLINSLGGDAQFVTSEENLWPENA